MINALLFGYRTRLIEFRSTFACPGTDPVRWIAHNRMIQWEMMAIMTMVQGIVGPDQFWTWQLELSKVGVHVLIPMFAPQHSDIQITSNAMRCTPQCTCH